MIRNKKIPLGISILCVLITAAVSVAVTWQAAGRERKISGDENPADTELTENGADALKTDTKESVFLEDTLFDEDKILVLYTNDIHCSMETDEDSLGMAGLAAAKEWAGAFSEYVTLIDCGDAIQGEVAGTLSEGMSMVNLMNELGYDVCTFGNHEFDYGMEQILTIAKELSKAEYVSCNFVELETESTVVKPYVIMEYDDISVAYVGICTPRTITASTPKFFMDENNNFLYGFCQGENGAKLYDAVQKAVDEARAEGADYVVAAAHLGINEDDAPYRSLDVIANTTGIDVVLDGHSHTEVERGFVKNKDGQNVILSSTGARLANVGCLMIDTKGTEDVSDDSLYTFFLSGEKSGKMHAAVKETKAEYDEIENEVMAYSDVSLHTADQEGNRMVRCRETNLGDFCADAYRVVSGADIGVINGGGIRADLPAGEITYGSLISVHPYGNMLCVVECTGAEILDMLEMAYRNVEAEYADENGPIGESGGFWQISGMKLAIDTGTESSVQLDENGMFVSVSGQRRVYDVWILDGETGEYREIDTEKTYTLASTDYMLHECGDGFSLFEDNVFVMDRFILDYQALITYVSDYLDGLVGEEYTKSQNRIMADGK
ncbi:MAG: bifunctional metallophosphatase/5'-nucleotidase [Lachnospiraceae bacterium]|nr:bifunctional metallophosphatase/5'-nucleotidase [Lachnospiraceae bacterium]